MRLESLVREAACHWGYTARGRLENQCATPRLISFPVPQGELDALTTTQKLHDEMVQSGNLRGAFRANMRFHELLFGLSDNPVLVAAIQDHAQRAHSVRSSSLVVADQLERARREHWSIIEALRNQDKEKLAQLCGDHLKPSHDNYIAAYHRRTGQ
jgi:DNA-binding GntR family transcriptional regulator